MKSFHRMGHKKITLLFLGFVFFFTSSFFVLPEKTEAIIPVTDIGDIIQNTLNAINSTSLNLLGTTLNPIAWALAKQALLAVVKNTVNSVNKGPNGTPGYTTNLASTLQAVGDTAANGFIQQLQTNGSIKSPYQTAVATAVKNNYLQSTGSNGYLASNPYTLNQVSKNPTAFYNGDLVNGGGMVAWMSAWENPANNPFGASQIAQAGLAASVGSAQDTQKTELNWGQGFAASRGKCPTTTTGGTSAATTLNSLISLASNSTCQSSAIKTPGSTIKTSLDKSLGSGIDTLVNAHGFGEIVTAVLGQLINQVFSSGGLSGVSQTSSSGATYFNQTDPSQTAINSQLTANFSSTLSGQVTQLQQYSANWNTINTAALTANTALTNSTCYPGAQQAMSTIVQPAIQQATAAIAQANSGISSLQSLQSQLQTIASSTADSTTALSNISSSYTSLQATLPSAVQIANAQAQSIDDSDATTSPPTLFTQLNNLTQAAQSCQTVTTGT
jgi:hypothetical protein